MGYGMTESCCGAFLMYKNHPLETKLTAKLPILPHLEVRQFEINIIAISYYCVLNTFYNLLQSFVTFR